MNEIKADIEERDGYIFNIEDIEITFLFGSSTKKLYHGSWKKTAILHHFHPYHEFFFMESGVLHATIEDRKEKLQKNDILIIAPGTPHVTAREDKAVRRYNLSFSIRRNGMKSSTPLYDKIKPIMKTPYFLIRSCGDLRETVKNIHSCATRQDAPLLGLYMHELIIKLSSYTASTVAEQEDRPIKYDTDMMRLHKIAHLVNTGRNEFTKLETIAKELQLSVRQTDRIIKKYYGVSYGELVLDRKMSYAAELVLTTRMSVTKISKELGYSSTKGFYYAFRKKYGCLPSEYRKQMKIVPEDEE